MMLLGRRSSSKKKLSAALGLAALTAFGASAAQAGGNPGTLSFDSSVVSLSETEGSVSVLIGRSGGVDGAVAVDCVTVQGTATPNVDYGESVQTLSWANGDGSDRTCTATLIDDDQQEGIETFTLLLQDFTGGATAGAIGSVLVRLLDDEDPGSLSFISTNYLAGEGSSTAEIGVRRADGTAGATSVECSTTGTGTATEGIDYTTTLNTLFWSDGEGGVKNCFVPILLDQEPEDDETAGLALNNVTGLATLGDPSEATLTILDSLIFYDGFESETPCFWNFVHPVNCGTSLARFDLDSYTVDEDVNVAFLAVHRQFRAFTGSMTVICSTVAGGTATLGTDYEAVSQQITWANQEQGVKLCAVPIADDLAIEGAETVHLELTLPGDAPGGAVLGTDEAVLTIRDVEEGVLSFVQSAYFVDENEGTISLGVRRTGGADGAVSVTCRTVGGNATAGVDYTSTEEVLAWADGDSSVKSCTVLILDDRDLEGNETVGVALVGPTGNVVLGAPSLATLNIVDTEEGALSFTQSDYFVNEDDGAAVLTVRRTGGTDGAVSVSCTSFGGTATAGSDYQPVDDLLTWADGDSTDKTCTITVYSDGQSENVETVEIELSGPTGNARLGLPSTATLEIADPVGDPGELNLLKEEFYVEEGYGIFVIAVERSNGSSGTISATCRTEGGTGIGMATEGLDYQLLTDSVTWADGDTSTQACAIGILDDFLAENLEIFAFWLSDPTGGAKLGIFSEAIVNIEDDDVIRTRRPSMPPGETGREGSTPAEVTDPRKTFGKN